MLPMPVFLIDAGHGSNTPGKRSPDGRFLEYRFNRQIASMLVDSLKAIGFTAFLLVKEEEDVSLAERCKRANAYCRQYGSKNVVFVSIHSNAAGNGKQWANARGWSVWTSPGKTESDTIATYLFEAARDVFPEGCALRKDMTDGDPDYESRFYVLVNTSCPAVLTESFFYDNKEDLAYLESDAGKKAIVTAHVLGLQRYVATLR